MTKIEQKEVVKKFVAYWKNKGYEKRESQKFWLQQIEIQIHQHYRNLYPNSSLADLYDELTMPSELRKAHKENDKAVMEAYGFNWQKMTESDCVAELMKMYEKILNL